MVNATALLYFPLKHSSIKTLRLAESGGALPINHCLTMLDEAILTAARTIATLHKEAERQREGFAGLLHHTVRRPGRLIRLGQTLAACFCAKKHSPGY